MATIDENRLAQVSRLDIVNTGRRRNFSAEAKLRIVAESFRGENPINATAQRHGLSRSQLYRWRKIFGAGLQQEGFVPAFVMSDPSGLQQLNTVQTGGPEKGRMEIVSANGRRVIVDSDVDVAALLRIVRGLETL